MYNTSKVKTALKAILGWRDHYNTSVVPALPTALTNSSTGQYYQQVHSAIDLEYIKATLRDDDTVEDYLARVEDDVIPNMLNTLIISKQVQQYNKELLRQNVIHNSDGFWKDTILNESRFVGISIRVHNNKGLKVQISKIGLQSTAAQTDLDIYVYHSSRKDPISVIQFNSSTADSFEWDVLEVELKHDDGEKVQGGVFYIGYYQDDLTGQAIQFKKLNWETGACRVCDGGKLASGYDAFNAYVDMSPFYVPSSSYVVGELFDPDVIIYSNDNNFGINLSFTIECDLTEFWVENAKSFVELQGLMVAKRVLNDMLFSPKVNFVEEHLKYMIIRFLEGDKETRAMNIDQRIEKALKAVNLNHGSLNSACLPCTKKNRTYIGTV